MESTYITPFIKSVQNVFETMLQLQVQIGEPSLKQGTEPSFDVSGIIGMSGDVEGSIVMSFPTVTAERIVGLFTGTQIGHDHDDFPDAVGELVNMVSGGAKANFGGPKVNISCPSVVIGKEHVVHGAKDMVCIHLPCQSDCGDFAVEVAVKQTPEQAAVNTTSAAKA